MGTGEEDLCSERSVASVGPRLPNRARGTLHLAREDVHQSQEQEDEYSVSTVISSGAEDSHGSDEDEDLPSPVVGGGRRTGRSTTRGAPSKKKPLFSRDFVRLSLIATLFGFQVCFGLFLAHPVLEKPEEHVLFTGLFLLLGAVHYSLRLYAEWNWAAAIVAVPGLFGLFSVGLFNVLALDLRSFGDARKYGFWFVEVLGLTAFLWFTPMYLFTRESDCGCGCFGRRFAWLRTCCVVGSWGQSRGVDSLGQPVRATGRARKRVLS